MTEKPAPRPAPPDPTGTAVPAPGPASRVRRSPEYRMLQRVLRGLRQELVEGAWDYRPLRPGVYAGRSRKAGTGQGTERGSGHLRARQVRAHATVFLLAAVTLGVGYVNGSNSYGTWLSALDGFVPAAAVLLTLLRPVAAFWVSLAASPVLVVLEKTAGNGSPDWVYEQYWPWLPGSVTGHVIVMTVVAMRTGPRAAAWMWGLSAVYGIGMMTVWDEPGGSDAVQTLIVSGVLLLCVALRQVRRAAQQEVTAERHVTAAERSRRTLLEERTTIARELHDVVAHHMSVVAIQAEAAPYRVQDPPPELAQAFATIRENAVAALTELRRLLGVVRAEDYEPPDAPQPTLADLDALLANVREAGLDVTRTVTGAVRELPQGVELSAYRIVQEALSNVLRHAPGASARVEVAHVLGGLGLRVVNGPPTAPPSPSPGAGHGVTGMRERVTMLGGDMTAGPLDDGGYEVAVFLTVAPPAADTEAAGTGTGTTRARSAGAGRAGAGRAGAGRADGEAGL